MTVDSASTLTRIGRERSERLAGGVRPWMFVPVDDDIGSASLARHGDGDHLVGETAGLMSGHGALMRSEGQFVLLVAANPVFAPQVFGCFDHAAADRMGCAAGGFAGSVQAVHAGRSRLGAPRCVSRGA